MIYLLELREKIRDIYSDNKEYCRLLYKFLMSFLVYIVISNTLDFNKDFLNIVVILFLSVAGTFLPNAITVLLSAIVSIACVANYSIVVGVIVFFILIIMYCLFIRFTPKLGYIILAIPLTYVFNFPCFIPMLGGLLFTPVVAVPIACGNVIYYLFASIRTVENVSNSLNKDEAMQIFIYVMKEFTENKAMFFSTIVVMTISVMVYIIRTRNISHPSEVSIVVAGVVYMFAFLIGSLVLDFEIHVIPMIFGTLASGVLAYIVQFFKDILDFSSVEHVQFEDDDYVYYVKAVPKVKISSQKNDIKKITAQKSNNGDGFDDDIDFEKIGIDVDKVEKDNKENKKEDIKKNSNKK